MVVLGRLVVYYERGAPVRGGCCALPPQRPAFGSGCRRAPGSMHAPNSARSCASHFLSKSTLAAVGSWTASTWRRPVPTIQTSSVRCLAREIMHADPRRCQGRLVTIVHYPSQHVVLKKISRFGAVRDATSLGVRHAAAAAEGAYRVVFFLRRAM